MRVASRLTKHFRRGPTNPFGGQSKKKREVTTPPSVAWRGTQDSQWKKQTMFLGGILIGVGATTAYHEFSAEGHVPTATSTAPIGSKIAREAGLGILGVPTPAQSQQVKHPQRQRMAQIKSREVRGVNAVCDEEGIPLEAQIADIFIMHDKIKPEAGSPLDSAFEYAIIKKFKQEFAEGMAEGEAIAGVEQTLATYEASNALRRKNSVSAIGVGAHSSYQKSKETAYKAKMAAKYPERTSKARNSLYHDEDAFSEEYQRDVEFYQKQIEESIADIERRIEENRAAGMYIGDEHNGPAEIHDRDDFVSFACTEMESIVSEHESSKEVAKSNIQTTKDFKAQAQSLRSDAQSTSEAQKDNKEDETPDNNTTFSA
ncbi:MAG: hypothetical protein P1U32_08125 [Legionellaceae bacterium]|nr:hypothetical protein [Legionellaceae bacterium]